ncbi:nucleotide exchange factor GrpE [Salinibacillus xinjiangensis]|uniref:Protein GrpE n=1 Tax=Salinibacillus xinjiangensis TaxID=1229268 RepID=A0A6G1X766_9BACI|nr:nucleotide exchange factor GrpE [Salinibacillus xinjiangensis]MRG86648.1 nucleotide exchange factor GrpE [Salinibacillus xinjiangensis]
MEDQHKEEMVDEEVENEETENVEEVTVEDVSVEEKEDSQQLDSLQSELEKVKKEKDELYQKMLRAQADFDNYKRRSKKERENDLKYKSQDVVTEILPVLDNFERALKTAVEDEGVKSFVDGVNMVYNQLVTALEKAGVEEIEADGKPFDPQFHQAVMQESDEEKESNTVTEVLQKGYLLKDRVIRPAMVKVNQ